MITTATYIDIDAFSDNKFYDVNYEGSCLQPLFFNIYMNEIGNTFNNSNLLYANDIRIFSV